MKVGKMTPFYRREGIGNDLGKAYLQISIACLMFFKINPGR